MGDCWRKAANMLAQTSHWNRVRKPAHYSLVKQKYKQTWVARKKEISDGYMAYLLTQETSAIEQNSSSRDGKKKKAEKKQRLRFRWSCVCKLVFVCQDVILLSLSMKNINYNYFFSINAGAIEWSTRKISTCYSADSVGRPHHISFQRVIFVFLIFGC